MATWMGSGIASGKDSRETAVSAANQALQSMGHVDKIKLVVVFAATSYDLEEVVTSIRKTTNGAPLIGCSSAGAFTAAGYEVDGIAVSTIASDHCEVNLGKASNYVDDIPAAVTTATENFHFSHDDDARPEFSGHSLFLLVDGLAGNAENLIDELIAKTGIRYQLFGGAAADELQFKRTYVFINDEVLTNSFVCAELLTEKPFSIVAQHGWKPLDGPYRVTQSKGSVLHELSGRPAWEVYQEFAVKHEIDVPNAAEVGFLMRYILGIQSKSGFKLRVPLALNSDGSLSCAAELLEGDVVYIMTSDDEAIISGNEEAIRGGIRSTGTSSVAGAFNFECVATRLHLGDRFKDQIDSTSSVVNPGVIAGCACFGQLARTENDFSGLACASSLVCLVPK